VLKLLLQRLEPKVAGVGHADFCTFEGEDVRRGNIAAPGMLHIAEAVLEAREALASDNDQRIIQAAMICASLERTGRDLAQHHRATEGGKRRGADQAGAAAALWQPYVQEFGRLLASGEAPAKARQTVVRKMVKEGFVLASGGFPDKRTIGKWLPGASKK
jgi:hypothetical protein